MNTSGAQDFHSLLLGGLLDWHHVRSLSEISLYLLCGLSNGSSWIYSSLGHDLMKYLARRIKVGEVFYLEMGTAVAANSGEGDSGFSSHPVEFPFPGTQGKAVPSVSVIQAARSSRNIDFSGNQPVLFTVFQHYHFSIYGCLQLSSGP